MAQHGDMIRKTCKRWNDRWQAHELTFSCFNRHMLLLNNEICGFLARAIDVARVKLAFHVWAYVFMPDHVHLLIWPTRETYSIASILQSIKQSLSRRAIALLKANDPKSLRLLATGSKDRPQIFWQEGGGYDRNIRTTAALTNSFAYIHDNPVVAELVAQPEDWYWSSAGVWCEKNGPISIDKQSFIDSMA